MRSAEDLKNALRRINGKSYRAYKDISGSYQFPGWQLFIDYVQGDPFAAPSKIRVRISQSDSHLPGEVLRIQ